MHQYSKTWNWIIQQIATFTKSKFVLRAVIYSFLVHPRTLRMAQRKYIKTQNWITQQILATFTSSKFILEAVVYSFLMNSRMLIMAQYAILFIPPPIPSESAGIWEFRRNLQELTGIPEFWRNPLESTGINWNLHKSRGVSYKRYNITFGNHLYKGLTSFSKFFSYIFIN